MHLNIEYMIKADRNTIIDATMQTLKEARDNANLGNLDIGYDDTRYPDGVQDFATLRESNMIYVDKTEYIYHLTRKPVSYFLSRPRRFGKSLLVSTLEAYFSGRKELFNGLAISRLEQKWTRYPVVRVDLSSGMFKSVEDVIIQLNAQIDSNAKRLQVKLSHPQPIERFSQLIAACVEKYGQKVVVLIDEYDKPLLETMYEADELHKDVHGLMRGFYGSLKGLSSDLRFVFVTGITKFTHVNIFSGLNNLTDISMQPWCNAICGISESELQENLSDDIKIFARVNGMTEETVRRQFKEYYDGYRFAKIGENIYNPYSVMRAFQAMEFSNYWFASGTPMHLIRTLTNMQIDFGELEGYAATQEELMGIPTVDGNPIALLYQSGYLTIKSYEDGIYILDFPNKEVKSGFYDALIQVLYPTTNLKGYSAANIRKAAIQGKPQLMVELLDKGLIDYNYVQNKDISSEAVLESLLYGLVHALGLNVKAEYHIANGRVDMVIETSRYVYLFEFKYNRSADVAISQIENNLYANRYKYDSRTLYKIGLNYDSRLRQISDFVITQ